jgi:hypothetical protein
MQSYDNFTDISIHSGKLSVDVTNAEMSNKTALYTMDQKTFYSSGGSSVAGRDNFNKKFISVLHHQEALSSRLLRSLKEQGSEFINGSVTSNAYFSTTSDGPVTLLLAHVFPPHLDKTVPDPHTKNAGFCFHHDVFMDRG